MRILADACVDVRVAEWLRATGHDVRHLREEGLHHLPDGEVFDQAIAEDRVLLTFDLDFAEIAAHSHGREVRVLLMRLRNPRAAHVVERLAAVLYSCESALSRSVVVIIEESRYRIRPLPIGRTEEPL